MSGIETSLDRLRQALREAVAYSGRELQDLSKELGRSHGHLGKLLNGHLQLYVREVFELLDLLELRPEDFFDVYFPLGGPRHARLRALYQAHSLPIWEVDVRSFAALEARRRGIPELSPRALEAKTARLLRQRLKKAGASQRSISLALNLSGDALGQALRGNTRLLFRHVFGILAEIGVRPERFFAELLGPDDGELVGTLRWYHLLDEIEAHLVPTVDKLLERHEAREREREREKKRRQEAKTSTEKTLE